MEGKHEIRTQVTVLEGAGDRGEKKTGGDNSVPTTRRVAALALAS